jgi:eukaryotic-like serine/threonine-protein kinase
MAIEGTIELTMTPERWERLKPLYHAALEMPNSARFQFANEACSGDEELMRELVSLLGAGDEETESDHAPAMNLTGPIPLKSRSFSAGELILDRFKVVRYVGGGGMGEVYEALDLEMGRVALKTIRTDVARDADMLSRFKKEVQLALKVTGRYVCRIHAFYMVPEDTGTSKRVFLTMEFLDGVSLADKLRESGPFPWREARSIALDICQGLKAIHEAGIIHRDLKSGNIFITSRGGSACAVLMDFGLAREFYPRDADNKPNPTLTFPGAVVGTPRYMAPEQFASDPLTPAADIFALGVVMYELVTGKHPFPSGTTLQAAVQRGRRPLAPSSIQKGLPRRCDAIVYRCLEFDPRRRYQSAAEAAAEIEGRLLSEATLHKRWFHVLALTAAMLVLVFGLTLLPPFRERAQGILFSGHEKHIAVLPFDVAGTDPQIRAIADGLMDSLAGKLSNLATTNASLWVVPATEVRTRKVDDAPSALRQFGASIVVEGNFSRDGPVTHLRLTLINPRKMREIGFTEIINQNGDLAALEDEAVTRLGRLMNITVAADGVADRQDSSGHAAYEDYLAGLGYIQRYDVPGNLDTAISLLQRAVVTDPRFALGFAELGEAYRLKYQLDHDTKWLEPAQTYCAKALTIDDNIASPYVTLALIHELGGRRDLARHELQRALLIDPSNASTINGLAYVYERTGNIALAEAMFKKAAALRPDDWNDHEELANFYERQRMFSGAFAEYNRALALNPNSAQIYTNLGVAYIDSGDPGLRSDAEKALTHSIALSPSYSAFANLGVLYGDEKRYSEYAAVTEKALQLDDHDWRVWDNLASAYEWLKDKGKASAARQMMLEHLQESLKVNPHDADAQSTVAIVYAHDGMEESALDHIRTALALDSNDPEILNNVADAYELLGQHRQAAAFLRMGFRKGLTRADVEQDPYLQGLISDKSVRIPPK